MHIQVRELPVLLAESATHAATTLRHALARQGQARLVAATGSSQITFLERLTREPGIDWRRVELFHLDEYIGIGAEHPASFCRFLLDRLVHPTGIERAHLIDGLGDPAEVAARVGEELNQQAVDLLICGIGENGHLAFNDPPADFSTTAPYLVVTLDDACRRQQVGEGWFPAISDVPRRAITMSIRQIVSAREIVCLAYGARKARAVGACFSGSVSPEAPASILQDHPNATVYLDPAAAAELRGPIARPQ